MDTKRIDEIEEFVSNFTGNEIGKAFRILTECRNYAEILIEDSSKLTAIQASDYYPRLALFLWLSETLSRRLQGDDDGGSGAAPRLTPGSSKVGLPQQSPSNINESVFHTLLERFPYLEEQLRQRRDELS